MRLKGIPWYEAHFEKVLVGVMLLLFLAVLVMQFVLQANRVTVDGQQLPLDGAYRPAEQEAERLIAQMDNTEPRLPELGETADLVRDFRRSFDSGVAPAERVAAFGESIPADVLGEPGAAVGNAFAAFEPPPPSRPVVAAYRATLDPYAVNGIEGIERILPDEQPYDTGWLSVQSSFGGADLRAAFERDPDGPGGELQRLRTDWWRSKTAVLAVEVERQERQADGTWSEPEPIEPLPGDEPVITLDESPANWRDLDDLAIFAAREADLVMRPEFFPVLEGKPWVPPSEVPAPDELEDNEAQIRLKLRRVEMIDREIERKLASLDGEQRPGGSGDSRLNNVRPESGRGREGGEREEERANEAGSARERRIQQQIEQLEEQAEVIREELESLGWQPEAGDDGVQIGFEPSDWRTEGDVLDADEIHLWRHDAEAEPGVVYRYRVRLVFANPLFGRQATLSDEMDPLAEEAFVRSSWSEWSEPATVGWSEYFFVEGASRGNNLGGATARAELYRFFYGYWRVAEVALSPGDRFVGEIDLPEGLQAWDVERAANEQAWVQGEDAEQPDGLELMPESLEVEADAWLLDVVASAFQDAGLGGQSEVTMEALIRGPDGRVSRRTPRLERSGPIYRVVRASAIEGEDQLPAIPGVGRRQRQADPEPPPGGGDGGSRRGRLIDDSRDSRGPGGGGGGGSGGG